MKEITAKTALVTGASGGIGRAISLALADAGVSVIASGRRADILGELALDLSAKAVRTHIIEADLSDGTAADSLVARAEQDVGPIDILINNAGVEQTAAFTDTTPNEIRTIVEVNLIASMLLTRRVIPGMHARGSGHIVFISSGLGKMGGAYQASYSAAKAALIGFTQALRAEYRGSGMGFSVVCPGLVTGAGMYQRILDEGFRASSMMGTTTTDRVARQVVDAIRHDRPEVLAMGAPFKPIAAAIQLNPRLAEIISSRAGMTELFRRVAAGRYDTE